MHEYQIRALTTLLKCLMHNVRTTQKCLYDSPKYRPLMYAAGTGEVVHLASPLEEAPNSPAPFLLCTIWEDEAVLSQQKP